MDRKNGPLGNFFDVAAEARRSGLPVSVELIVPLPLEIKESYLNGLRVLYESDVSLLPYTTMMLRDAEIARKENRERYGMITKFRLLPRQFGEYRSGKCFEIEEVCVGTNTMPFEDYVECRGISLLVTLFNGRHAFREALHWASTVRDIGPVVNLEPDAFKEIILDLRYDVPSWYVDSDTKRPLTGYRRSARYAVTIDEARIRDRVENGKKLFDARLTNWVARFLEFNPITHFRRTSSEIPRVVHAAAPECEN